LGGKITIVMSGAIATRKTGDAGAWLDFGSQRAQGTSAHVLLF
jgi:hypothetical protein